MFKILGGLEYLHWSDVVHCDFKAANILTTKTHNVKLSDFRVSLNPARDGAQDQARRGHAELGGTRSHRTQEHINKVGYLFARMCDYRPVDGTLAIWGYRECYDRWVRLESGVLFRSR